MARRLAALDERFIGAGFGGRDRTPAITDPKQDRTRRDKTENPPQRPYRAEAVTDREIEYPAPQPLTPSKAAALAARVLARHHHIDRANIGAALAHHFS